MKLRTDVIHIWEDDNFQIKLDPDGTPYLYWKRKTEPYSIKEQLALAIDFLQQVRNNVQDV